MGQALILLFFATLLLGVPVAFTMGIAGLGAILMDGSLTPLMAAQRLFAGVDSFPLMAVPLFMLAGHLMEEGGLSARLVNLAQALVGWLPGGLAAASVLAAMFFAGISGSAAADTAAVGALLVPAMVRSGYPPAQAAAIQAAAGSIGVVIPPSIPMIVFAVLTGASVGQLFAAGFLPGVLMGLTLVLAASLIMRQSRAEPGGGVFCWRHAAREAKRAGWALGAPLVILGGILGGIFTATESAAVAVFYAIGVGMLAHGELRLSRLPRMAAKAALTSAVVMFIIAQASVLSWVLAVERTPQVLAHSLLAWTSDPLLLLLLVNGLLLAAGAVLETTAALVLLVPVIAPLAPELGLDVVQLGAIMVVNLAIGMLTPPLGICLIVACGLSGAPLATVARAVLPLLLALLADLALVSFWKPLTMWLPQLLR